MFRSSDFSWRSAQTLALPTIATTVSFALTLAMHRTSGFRSTKCELRGSQPFFRAFTTLKRKSQMTALLYVMRNLLVRIHMIRHDVQWHDKFLDKMIRLECIWKATFP